MRLGLGLSICSAQPSLVFDPTTVANMYLRYRAVSAVVSSGVSSVPNEGTLGHGTSNVNDLAALTANPAYVASDSNHNGRPSIRHNNNSGLKTGTLSSAIPVSSTWYARTYILDTNDANNAAIHWSSTGSSTNTCLLVVNPSTNTIYAGETSLVSVVSTALFGAHTSCLVRHANGSVDLYVDDMTTPILSGASGTNTCASLCIGYGFGAGTVDMSWPEEMAYGGEHDVTTRALIKSYFTANYG